MLGDLACCSDRPHQLFEDSQQFISETSILEFARHVAVTHATCPYCPVLRTAIVPGEGYAET
jgi:hypothetical protein